MDYKIQITKKKIPWEAVDENTMQTVIVSEIFNWKFPWMFHAYAKSMQRRVCVCVCNFLNFKLFNMLSSVFCVFWSMLHYVCLYVL